MLIASGSLQQTAVLARSLGCVANWNIDQVRVGSALPWESLVDRGEADPARGRDSSRQIEGQGRSDTDGRR